MKARPPLGDMSWQDHAACLGRDPAMFFPTERGEGGADLLRQAQEMCAGCVVRCQCLEFAVANRETSGVWGGLHGPQLRKVTGGRIGRRAS